MLWSVVETAEAKVCGMESWTSFTALEKVRSWEFSRSVCRLPVCDGWSLSLGGFSADFSKVAGGTTVGASGAVGWAVRRSVLWV